MNKEKHISCITSSCAGKNRKFAPWVRIYTVITNFLRKNTFKKIKHSLI